MIMTALRKSTKLLYVERGYRTKTGDRSREYCLQVFYKIITGKYDSNCSLQLYLRSELVHASVTRGNYYKHCRYDLRKYYFTNTVVPVWNSLPNEVVMADNINILNRLDKFWASYDFVYLFRAQPLETGRVT